MKVKLMNRGVNMAKVIGMIIGLLLGLGVSFSLVAISVYCIFWCFGLIFTWKIALGIWLGIMLFKLIMLKPSSNKK